MCHNKQRRGDGAHLYASGETVVSPLFKRCFFSKAIAPCCARIGIGSPLSCPRAGTPTILRESAAGRRGPPMTSSLRKRMQILVIRHGTAEDAANGDDARRELTKAGRKEMKEVAAGLKTIIESIDAIGASPLVRAQQTAEIVAKAYGDLSVDTVDTLTPDSDPSELGDWLAPLAWAEVVAIVGHEPHLGHLVTWFMTGAGNSRVALSKGGAALLELSGRPTAGSGTLQWLLTRSQLRHLG